MRNILLDTHVWLWISMDDQRSLSRKARNMLVHQKNSGSRWISAISCWELAKLVERGRIGFSIPVLDWIKRSLKEKVLEVAELSPEIAVESTRLAGFHRDPADQIIAATSRILGLPLITADRKMQDFSGIETIW